MSTPQIISSNKPAQTPITTTPDVTVETRPDGVAVLNIDVPGERMNILGESFFPAAQAALDEVEQNPAIKAAVIISGKPDSFIAGADINIIKSLQTVEEAAGVCRLGHSIMDRIAASKKPYVVAIHGVALGGGCELALACHARVLSDDPKTALGLPEVNLGVLPGFGGSQRLPRLIGVASALDMMLTGKHIYAYKARSLGLADEVVYKPILLQVAVKIALDLVKGLSPRKKKPWTWYLSPKGLQSLVLERNPFGRRLVLSQARKQVYAKTRGNYPAPEKIIEVVEYGMGVGMTEALNREIRRFAELAVTPQAKQLMNIYFGQTALKKESFAGPDVKPLPVRKLGILGGGLMGAGIAMVSLDKAGADVRIKDINDKGIRNSMKHAYEYYQDRVRKRILQPTEAAQRLNRFTGALDYSGFKSVDLVIEAVFEDLKLKRQMVSDIETLGNVKTVFATNTSSIPIKDIAQGAMRPERIIGMHYFSPVEKMPLLEIIRHSGTSDETIATAVAFGKQQGKTVIVVKDVPGFYINRILFPYINEAGYLAMEGVPIDAIDSALTNWGMPVGPFKLMDEVGLDVGVKVQHILAQAYGKRMQASEMVDKLIADQRLGKKVKKGFYDYKSGGRQVDASVYTLLGIKPDKSLPAQEIAERCMLPLLNEAALCLDEQVITSTRDGDIGTVFGIGFPPFRGGPFRYMDGLGAGAIVTRLKHYQQAFGERFQPAPNLEKMAQANGRFYKD
ncbi:MAG TPA: fatty acid oxidation complex subunit alpha FadJ [Gammaproteobacteria bacterium]|nr:fatty acid oxidation complex subunit alpha FadJ [Gammaproteobacteria bacterium]